MVHLVSQDLSVAGLRKGLKHGDLGDEEVTRSGLFMEQVRIVKEMRARDLRTTGRSDSDVRCRWLIWENVPGVLSSGTPKGADFAAVIEEIVKIVEPEAAPVLVPEKGWPKAGCFYDEMGRWSVAYRIVDAQWWGTPQRRKRIALVADLNGLLAPSILFDPQLVRATEDGEPVEALTHTGAASRPKVQSLGESVSGHSESSGTARQGTAAPTESRTGSTGKCLNGWDVQSKHVQPRDGIAEALYSGECRGGGGESYVLDDAEPSKVFGISAYESNAMKSSNPHSGIYEADTARTLDLNGGSPACNQGGMVVLEGNQKPCILDAREPLCIEMTSTKNTVVDDGVSPTLTARMGTGGNQVNAVMETYQDVTGTLNPGAHPGSYNGQDAYNDMLITGCFQNTGQGWWNESDVGATIRTPCGGDSVKANLVTAVDCRNGTENPETNGTLQAKSTGGIGVNFQNVCRTGATVRRLTPGECERLQGFPDGWTDIGEWVDTKGKKHKEADSPRYKALGNSIAVGYANNQSGFWVWLARRICATYERQITLGSLFDGISGFCLAFAAAGAKPVFSSEIEQFPIAVAKKHFGDDDAGTVGDIKDYLNI